MNKRRGVSNIIGSLIVLALVASVGSVILFQGLGQINSFNYDLTFFDNAKNNELREDVMLEHIRFVNGTSNIEINLANIGTVETTISTVTMVHNPSQELVLAWVNPLPAKSEDGSRTIRLDSNKQINMTAILECPSPSPVPTLPDCVFADNWNNKYYNNTEYNLSITTSKGKIFDFGPVAPWNT
jgi:hypothetical protein